MMSFPSHNIPNTAKENTFATRRNAKASGGGAARFSYGTPTAYFFFVTQNGSFGSAEVFEGVLKKEMLLASNVSVKAGVELVFGAPKLKPACFGEALGGCGLAVAVGLRGGGLSAIFSTASAKDLKLSVAPALKVKPPFSGAGAVAGAAGAGLGVFFFALLGACSSGTIPARA